MATLSTTHSQSLFPLWLWNITPLTASFTLQTPQQHVYALSAPSPLPICMSFFFFFTLTTYSLSLFLFHCYLSFIPSFSLFIPEDRVIMWTICSPPAPMCPSFPHLSPPCGRLPPLSPPPCPCLPLNLSCLLPWWRGLWGPHRSPEPICVTSSRRSPTRQQEHKWSNTRRFLEMLRATRTCHTVWIHRGSCAHMWMEKCVCVNVAARKQEARPSSMFVLTWTRRENSVTKPLSSFRSWEELKKKINTTKKEELIEWMKKMNDAPCSEF